MRCENNHSERSSGVQGNSEWAEFSLESAVQARLLQGTHCGLTLQTCVEKGSVFSPWVPRQSCFCPLPAHAPGHAGLRSSHIGPTGEGAEKNAPIRAEHNEESSRAQWRLSSIKVFNEEPQYQDYQHPIANVCTHVQCWDNKSSYLDNKSSLSDNISSLLYSPQY